MATKLDSLRDWKAEYGIILGSGLSGVVRDDAERISYSQFSELPVPSVPGHAGEFALARVGNFPVIFAQGRVHLYEGFSAREVTAGIRLLAGSGVKKIILTNAAGSLNPQFAPGSWMMITDHINLTGASPLIGAPQFLDQSQVYSGSLRDRFGRAAAEAGIQLKEGVYACMLGPQYETPAEVRMLQKLGADAVGMSTVLEAIQARAIGLEVAGFSCLTNFGAGISQGALDHAEVLDIGRKASADFARLLAAALAG